MRYKYIANLKLLFFAPSHPSTHMPTCPHAHMSTPLSATRSTAVPRLWCRKRASRSERRNAPIALASIKQRYAALLVVADVQDLAFM
jgi:hypothetical protein